MAHTLPVEDLSDPTANKKRGKPQGCVGGSEVKRSCDFLWLLGWSVRPGPLRDPASRSDLPSVVSRKLLRRDIRIKCWNQFPNPGGNGSPETFHL